MDKKRILVITDSLGLPRLLPQLVKYEETYISLLQKNGFDVVNLSIGGGNIKLLVEQSEYYRAFFPDIVIVQSGIVDCAPRAFRKFELDFLVKSRLIKLFNEKMFYILRKYRIITYTSKSTYKSQLKILLNKFSDAKFIFIGILKPMNEYEKIVPGIKRNILDYNNILRSINEATYIDLFSFPSDGIQSDFHHLNAKGHNEIYQRLKAVLDKI